MEPGPGNATSSTMLWVVVIALVAAGALATRMLLVGDKSLWLDEAFSWRMAEISLSQMVDRTKNDVHPPLFYAVLHYWIDLFGDSEFSLRMPSALAGSTTIVLIAAAGWRIAGLRLALLSAALVILNPACLQYTQDARFYPLVSALALGATLAQARFVTKPAIWPIVLYVALAVPLAYTHYSGLVVIGVQGVVFGIYGLIQIARDRDYSIMTGAAFAGLAIVLAYTPWWSTLIHQIDYGGGYVPDPTIKLAGATLRGGLGLRQTHALWVLFALPMLAAIAWGLYRRREDARVMCIAALAAVPVGLLISSYLVSPAFDTKRASPFIAPLGFMIALGIVETYDACTRLAEQRRSLAQGAVILATCALMLAMGIGLVQWYQRGPYEDWRQIGLDLRDKSGPVYYYAGYLNDPLAYYVDDQDKLYALTPKEDQVAQSVLLASGRTPGDTAYLILSHAAPDDADTIKRVLSGPYQLSEAVEYSDDTIELYTLISKRRSATTQPVGGATP